MKRLCDADSFFAKFRHAYQLIIFWHACEKWSRFFEQVAKRDLSVKMALSQGPIWRDL